MGAASDAEPSGGLGGRIGLLAGPGLGAALVAWTHPSGGAHGGLSAEGALTLGMLAWMSVWWVTQAVELAVTALIPLVALPLLGLASFRQVAACFSDSVIFLFAGGSVIAMALDRHGLTARFVHALLSAAGTRPVAVMGAVFVASACVSAFVSNTATAALVLPLAMGLVARAAPLPGSEAHLQERSRRNFASAVLLAVAYGATVGGGATLVGSPPNGVAANYLRAEGVEVTFLSWLKVGLPVAVLAVPVCIAVIAWMLPCGHVRLSHERRQAFPRLGFAGRAALAVFAATVACWVVLPSLPEGWKPKDLPDGAIAAAAAAVLLALPARDGSGERIVPWDVAKGMPWHVFILFGGGLAIGEAMERNGVSQAIGGAFAGLGDLPRPVILGTIVTCMAFASEVGSNTALAATAIPVVAAAGPALGLTPQEVAFATALGASYAFMLPVGTPPNALVFGTGMVRYRDMVRVGFVLNVAMAALVTAALSVLC